jgi:hypothetical protein
MVKSFVFAACALGCVLWTANTAIADDSKAASDSAHRVAPDCPRDTGTRLPVKPEECAAFGRSYSQRDIQRTNTTTTADALKRLSPSLNIR